MKVSIIIPCYNYEQYIEDCIMSCVSQQYEGEIEIIVVDDCSTDKSRAIIRILASKYSAVKEMHHADNFGYSAAKNTGLRESTGDLICTLDADDMLTPYSIDDRVEEFRKYPALQMVWGGAYIIDKYFEFADWLDTHKLKVHHRADKVNAQGVMLRRDVYQRFGLYYEPLRSRGDNEYWNRLSIWPTDKIEDRDYLGEVASHRMPANKPVAFYRRHSKTMINYRKANPKYNEEQTKILEDRKALIRKDGITKDNTEFLDA